MTPGERTVLSGLHRVIQAYDGLPDEQQARFGRQVAIRANELLSIASESRALADIPISQPDALQPFKGRKKHSTVNSRLMTAYERAESDSQLAAREARAKAKDKAVLEARALQYERQWPQLSQHSLIVVDTGKDDDDDEDLIQEELTQLHNSTEPAPPSLPPSPPAQSSARPTASPPQPTVTPDLADGLRRSKRHRSPSRRMREAMEEDRQERVVRPSKRGRR